MLHALQNTIYFIIEFGAYIEPENYFVAYIFHTNVQLSTAKQSGLLEKIIIPFKELRIVVLRRKSNVIKNIMEIGIITLNSVNRNLGGICFFH